MSGDDPASVGKDPPGSTLPQPSTIPLLPDQGASELRDQPVDPACGGFQRNEFFVHEQRLGIFRIPVIPEMRAAPVSAEPFVVVHDLELVCMHRPFRWGDAWDINRDQAPNREGGRAARLYEAAKRFRCKFTGVRKERIGVVAACNFAGEPLSRAHPMRMPDMARRWAGQGAVYSRLSCGQFGRGSSRPWPILPTWGSHQSHGTYRGSVSQIPGCVRVDCGWTRDQHGRSNDWIECLTVR